MTTFYGTDINDNIGPGHDAYYGGKGDDQLHAGGGAVSGVIYVEGGQGKDFLDMQNAVAGQSGHLYGGDGDDFAVGSMGADYIYGGLGSDVMVGGKPLPYSFSDGYIFLTAGNDSGADVMYGGQDSDAIFGFAGNDILYGGDGDDTHYLHVIVVDFNGTASYIEAGLYGGDGDDYLDGGLGSDDLYGGAGNDVIVTGDGIQDTVSGGGGNDLLVATTTGANPNDYAWLYGDAGNDGIVGAAGADRLYGGSGQDVLVGWGGNDFMMGNEDVDAISGGIGNDTFYGGSGGDYFNLVYDVKPGQYEVIGDFKGSEGDWIILPSYAATSISFGQSGQYVFATISGATGNYTIFLFNYFNNTSIADLQSHIYYV